MSYKTDPSAYPLMKYDFDALARLLMDNIGYGASASSVTTQNIASLTTTVSTIISANTSRKYALLQNNGTMPVYVKMGTAATTTLYSFILSAGLVANDGTGGDAVIDFYNGV